MKKDTQTEIEIGARFNGGNGGASIYIIEVNNETDEKIERDSIFVGRCRAIEVAIDLVQKATGHDVPDDIKQRLRSLAGPGRLVLPAEIKEPK